jgi:hypothetical protein
MLVSLYFEKAEGYIAKVTGLGKICYLLKIAFRAVFKDQQPLLAQYIPLKS